MRAPCPPPATCQKASGTCQLPRLSSRSSCVGVRHLFATLHLDGLWNENVDTFYVFSMLNINIFATAEDENNEDDCAGSVYCPPECQCRGTVVRCSRSHLTQIPRGIPPDTTELWVGSRLVALYYVIGKPVASNSQGIGQEAALSNMINDSGTDYRDNHSQKIYIKFVSSTGSHNSYFDYLLRQVSRCQWD